MAKSHTSEFKKNKNDCFQIFLAQLVVYQEEDKLAKYVTQLYLHQRFMLVGSVERLFLVRQHFTDTWRFTLDKRTLSVSFAAKHFLEGII